MGTKCAQNGLGGGEGAGGVAGCSGGMLSRRALGFAAEPEPVLRLTPLPRPLPAALGLSFPTRSGRFAPQNPAGASRGSAVGEYRVFWFFFRKHPGNIFISKLGRCQLT